MQIFNILKKMIPFYFKKDSSPVIKNSSTDIFSIYPYLNEEGHFDYEQYKQAQIEANISKIDQVWVKEENISFLADYIRHKIGRIRFGICHGTRRGIEQQWFKKYLSCKVIGTEISNTAKQFKDTIEWDFHEVKDEWIDSADFIYSNSLDHSYDPKKCLNAWTSCLNKNGLLIIEHSEDDNIARKSDPFGVSLFVLPYIVLTWSNGFYCVVEILKSPYKTKFENKEFETHFLIVKKNDWPNKI